MRRLFTFCLPLFTLLFSSTSLYGQVKLWVGETYRWEVNGQAQGLVSDISWSCSGGYISMTGSGFYRDITPTQYFSGNATVEVSWKYRYYSSDTPKTYRNTLSVSCYDNPITISPTSLKMVPGDKAELYYDLKYDNSYSSAAKPYFSTGSTIISVTNNGTVTAHSPGTAYVNVYSKSSSNSPYCTIVVEEVYPKGVSVTQNITLIEGKTSQLKATPTPSNATTSYKWESEDNSIASVSSTGLVTAIKAGKTRIKVTTTNGNYSAYCNVTVKTPPPPPTEVSLKNKIQIYKGFSTQLIPILKPSNAETTYKWKSNDTSIASVSSNGKITANNIGQTEIILTTANDLEASCLIIVVDAPEYIDSNKLTERVSILESMTKTALNYVK